MIEGIREVGGRVDYFTLGNTVDSQLYKPLTKKTLPYKPISFRSPNPQQGNSSLVATHCKQLIDITCQGTSLDN